MNTPTTLRHTTLAVLTSLGLSGCLNLAPPHERPAVNLPPPPAGVDASDSATTALPGWRDLVTDARLRELVELAQAHNHDLKLAVLTLERTRAQLRLADADRWPTLNAALSASRAPNSQGEQTNTFQAGLQLPAWELDLFGRLANSSQAAQASVLASESASRSVRLALLTQTVGAWLTLAADSQQLHLAQRSLRDRQSTQALAALRLQVGAIAEPDWRSVQALTAQAQASVAQWQRQQAADLNALHQLVGAPVPARLLPSGDSGFTDTVWLAEVPAQLSSQVLLARPDVIQAEQQLRAAQANIGIARAALFPRISLSGSAGLVSGSLAGLLDGATFAWSLGTQATLALWDNGRNQATVRVAEINRDMALAQYEKTAYTAFREAADALSAQASWRDQTQAQRQLASAEAQRHRLSRLKFDAGAISQLEWLDAERSLVAAEQALVQTQLAQWLNRLALYKALGGDERVLPGSGHAASAPG